MNEEKTDYLSLAQCKHRHLYRIDSRNFSLGVYDETSKGFIGIREKFGDEFLFTEFHWDTGAPFGTVRPKEELERLPDEIEVRERFDTIDKKTKRLVEFNHLTLATGTGWRFVDTGESSDDIEPLSPENKKLFDWLKKSGKNNGPLRTVTRQ